MVSKQSEVPLEEVENGNCQDEGWWASVLGDVESTQTSRTDAILHSSTPSGMESVNWQRVRVVFDRDEIVLLEVYGYNRGGLLVQGEGIQGFVPVSHLVGLPNNLDEKKRQIRLGGYVGRSLALKVIECEPSLERIVLSERAAQAGEGRRNVLFKSLKPGDVVSGVVTNVTDFGAFVDLGGVEGLVHVSELSWGRVQHPSNIVAIGQEVDTMVLQVSEESSRVALSLKRLYPNPWENLEEKYRPGDVISATVTKIMCFGAFARLEEGVEGLIHISSMNLQKEEKALDQILHHGQLVRVKILHIDSTRRRLGLGLVTT